MRDSERDGEVTDRGKQTETDKELEIFIERGTERERERKKMRHGSKRVLSPLYPRFLSY